MVERVVWDHEAAGSETSHSDQNPSEINDFRGVFLFFVYCGADFELSFLTHIFDEHRLNIVFFAESQYN